MYGFVSATIGFDEQDAELSEKVKLINKMKKAAKRIRESVKIRDKMYAQDLHAPYDNPINVIVKVKTYDNTMDVDVYIKDGELHYYDYLEPEADYNAGTVSPPDEFFHKSTVIFSSMEILKKYEASDLDASIRLMTTDVWVEGNPAAFSYLSYLFSLTEPDASKALITEQKEILKGKTFAAATEAGRPDRDMRKERMAKLLVADSHDPGVCHIQEEQFLAKYTLDQFPRLESMKKDYLAAIPEVTSEQGELLTEYFMQHGYDKKADGTPWHPALRSAHGFRHLMSHKKPVLRENDLIAGTLTPNPICGSITTPFTIGWSIWGDLEVMEERSLEAYTITEKTKTALSKKVFPFWMDKHIMQVWKDKVAQDIPDAVAPRLNDRLFFMIPWSLMSLNPSCPDFDGVVKYGLQGFRQKIEESREAFSQEPAETGEALQDRQNRLDTLDAMKIALEGVSEYVKRLAEQVGKEAQAAKQAIEVKKAQPSPKYTKIDEAKDLARLQELETMHDILLRVPEQPAKTLQEAIQAIWIMFIGVGLETMDDTITLGRLDQMLQPYFEADIKGKQGEEKEAYIKHAIELVGCLFLRLTSHRIVGDTIRTWQSSGSPGTASIMVGGVRPKEKYVAKPGDKLKDQVEDAVNDMTYIILKVTDLLSMDDPDLDARYMEGVNSANYLKRVCEVNYLTSGTPALHNDTLIIPALTQHPGWKLKDATEWVSGGCVEPIIAGKHYASTGDVDTNLTVPLVMALLEGYHPQWNRATQPGEVVGELEPPLGYKTPPLREMKCFDDFFEAFTQQCDYIYDLSIKQASHKILQAAQIVMPAPLYSAILGGCIESGKGLTHGGAEYNSSGSSSIGLSDVVDSLLVINQLVFHPDPAKRVPFEELKDAVVNNFGEGKKNLLDGVDMDGVKLDKAAAELVDKASNIISLSEAAQRQKWRKLYTRIRTEVRKFGSNDDAARAMVKRVTEMVAGVFRKHKDGRGGHYTIGYRSNNNHTVFGKACSALPSGRLANVPFTSGLTPSPMASKNMLDNLMDVACIDPMLCDNNYTFNVRLSFSKKNSHAENIERIAYYVQEYFKAGGMQIQFNMVDADTLKDAMDNPEFYPDLIARVAGYTGYYTKMNRDLQLEIIGRTEFGI